MMNIDEKLEKICNDFSILNEEQQDYILGIMQALVFAKNTSQAEGNQTTGNQNDSENQPLSNKK